MALIASGDQSTAPDVQLEPGRTYTYTISVPVELPDWAAAGVVTIVSTLLGAVAAIVGVTTRPAGAGWTDIVIEFAT